jgi:hypothetical protein
VARNIHGDIVDDRGRPLYVPGAHPYPVGPPVFTKKHYTKLAEALKRARQLTYADKHSDTEQKLRGVNEAMCSLIVLFKRDNPNFDEFLFIRACTDDTT